MHLASELLHHRQPAPLEQRAPMASTMQPLPLVPLERVWECARLLVERALLPSLPLAPLVERVSAREQALLPAQVSATAVTVESSSGECVVFL